MDLYSFKRLIEKYSVTCQLVTTTEGSWDAGFWQDGQTTVTDVKGAVVPISEKRIQNSGGFYNQGDCEFITTQPIVINSNTHIIHKEKSYKLEDSTDYSDYADFYIYVARGAGAFDKARGNTESNA